MYNNSEKGKTKEVFLIRIPSGGGLFSSQQKEMATERKAVGKYSTFNRLPQGEKGDFVKKMKNFVRISKIKAKKDKIFTKNFSE